MSIDYSVAVSIGLLLVSTAALVVAIRSWHKGRVAYGTEEMVLRKISGGRDDESRGMVELNEKLKTGRHAVLGVSERSDGDWVILLTQIK